LFNFGFNKFDKGALMLFVKAGRVLIVLKYDFSQEVCEPSRSGAFPWLKENDACSKSRTPKTDLATSLNTDSTLMFSVGNGMICSDSRWAILLKRGHIRVDFPTAPITIPPLFATFKRPLEKKLMHKFPFTTSVSSVRDSAYLTASKLSFL
jgi:hypothetical protein